MKTLIAVPCMDMLPLGFVKSLLYMNKGGNPTVYFLPNTLIYDGRNMISLYAIENEFDNVMWFDSDMLFPPDTLLRLQAHNTDIVSGLYVKRRQPVEPVLYEKIEEPTRDQDGKLKGNIEPYINFPRDSYFQVAGCGFGCVLTSTKLLKDVWDKFGPAFAPYPWAGEDLSFCYRARKLGYQIYCDSTISCGHIGTFTYTEDMLKRGDKD